MRTGVIIQKKAGQLIPTEFLEVALKNNVGAGGFIIQDKEENGDGCLITDRVFDKSPTLQQLNDLQTEYKEQPMLLWLGNGQFSEQSAQPFVLSSSEGPDVLACMFEGDFSKYVDTKSPETEEYAVFQKVVEPLLLKAWKYSEGTYESFIGELDATFEQSLMNAASHRCVFAFMPVTGDTIAFGNNELGEVYDWGTVSNKYDYAPGSAAAQAPAKKKGWFNRSKAEAPAAAPTPAANPSPAPATPAAAPAAAPGDGKTDTAIPASDLKGHYEDMPDTVIRGGNKAMKLWLRKIYGLKGSADLPEGWRSQRRFFIPDVPIKDFKELKERMEGAKIVETKPKDMREPAPVVKTATANPKSGGEIAQQRKEEANTMVLSLEEATKAGNVFATFLDYKSKEAPDPKLSAAMEAKYPKFTEKVPVSLNELLLITPKQWESFQKDNPKAFLLAMLEIKSAYVSAANIKLEDLIPAPSSEPAAPVKEETKPATPAAAPAAKGRGSLFRKTA